MQMTWKEILARNFNDWETWVFVALLIWLIHLIATKAFKNKYDRSYVSFAYFILIAVFLYNKIVPLYAMLNIPAWVNSIFIFILIAFLVFAAFKSFRVIGEKEMGIGIIGHEADGLFVSFDRFLTATKIRINPSESIVRFAKIRAYSEGLLYSLDCFLVPL